MSYSPFLTDSIVEEKKKRFINETDHQRVYADKTPYIIEHLDRRNKKSPYFLIPLLIFGFPLKFEKKSSKNKYVFLKNCFKGHTPI